MKSWMTYPRVAAALGLVLLVATPLPSAALTKCTARIRGTDGAILVSARKVSGTLLWGAAAGEENNSFYNAATCVKAKVRIATGCQLGAPGTSEQITPPESCGLFLVDGAGTCSAHISGCTPGVRESAPPTISYATCAGPTTPAGTKALSSSCSVSCPSGTKIVGGACDNGTTNPQFMQGYISDPGTNTMWSCEVENSNSVSQSITAQGTAICLPQ